MLLVLHSLWIDRFYVIYSLARERVVSRGSRHGFTLLRIYLYLPCFVSYILFENEIYTLNAAFVIKSDLFENMFIFLVIPILWAVGTQLQLNLSTVNLQTWPFGSSDGFVYEQVTIIVHSITSGYCGPSFHLHWTITHDCRKLVYSILIQEVHKWVDQSTLKCLKR